MAADGTMNIRLNENRPVPARVSAPFGQAISLSSGTVTLYRGVQGDTLQPLVKPALLGPVPYTSGSNVTPSSVKALFVTNPSGLGLTVDTKYTMVFSLVVTAGASNYTFEVVVILTVLDDTE